MSTTITNFLPRGKTFLEEEAAEIMAETNGLRAQTVRRLNLALVFAIVRSGSSSRSDLVAATGLTRSAIGGLVGDLESLGLVYEQDAQSDGRPGRPSPVVRLDDRHVAALAVDISVHSAAVAVVGIDGTVIRSTRVGLPAPPVSSERVCTLVVDLAAQLGCAGGRATGRRLVGIGVSIPALVRQPGNIVAFAPNLDWHDVALGDQLAAEFEARLDVTTPVIVANDADLAGIAEVGFGVAARNANVLFVHGGVGVGGAFVAAGNHLTGHLGFSGEVGHVPVNPDGAPCHCGGHGCWETEIGTQVLLDHCGLSVDDDADTVRAVLGALETGDGRAMAAVERHGRWVGIGLAGLINVLDPETVVLGGLLGQLLPTFEAAMQRELTNRNFRGIGRSVPIVASQLGDDATLIGAAQAAFGALLHDPLGVVRSDP